MAVILFMRCDIVVELDTENAPLAVNNFVFLARWSYYDGVRFHSVVPHWVIQTGDPIGCPPGYGSPGYTIPDELPPDGSPDQLYSVVMAGHADQPNSSGGQFYIVTGWASHQGSRFTRFGRVVKRRGVVNAIDATGHRPPGRRHRQLGPRRQTREPTTIRTHHRAVTRGLPAQPSCAQKPPFSGVIARRNGLTPRD